jgi:hypothetical protein
VAVATSAGDLEPPHRLLRQRDALDSSAGEIARLREVNLRDRRDGRLIASRSAVADLRVIRELLNLPPHMG